MSKEQAMFNLGGQPESKPADSKVNASADAEGLVFDLSDVEEQAFEVLPRGTYEAIIEEFEYTTAQSSGNPMLKIVYTITSGEFAERKIFDYLVLAGEGAKYSLPRLKQLLIRVCPEVNISTFNPSEFADAGTILNRPCQIRLNITTQKSGEYKGEKRNQVREVLSANTSGSFLG